MEADLYALENDGVLPLDDGYRGIWYYNEPLDNEYVFKYSGGLGTYPQQLIPLAVHAPEVNKTFFCYGGSLKERNELVHCVSWFDHATGTVPRPRVLLNKRTDDAHDNPTMMIDEHGHIWIFSNAHGTSRPSYIHRSVAPYSVDRFEHILTTNFSYFQPWYLRGKGFIAPHVLYNPDRRPGLPIRRLFCTTSGDGRTWSEPILLAGMHKGHYHSSYPHEGRIGVMFNYHPEPVGLNARANVFYMETEDGETWRTSAGEKLDLPLTDPACPALVHDTEAEGLLAYIKGVAFDIEGHPVLHYVTSKGFETGPENDPRMWTTARWTGDEWVIRPGFRTTSNYDFGPLYIEEDGLWRIIASTENGPQPYNTGGEVAVWQSDDQGQSWKKARELTEDSKYNHAYVRKPYRAHPDFYGFWADGHGRRESESFLYYTSRDAEHVWRLPPIMEGDAMEPEMVW